MQINALVDATQTQSIFEVLEAVAHWSNEIETSYDRCGIYVGGSYKRYLTQEELSMVADFLEHGEEYNDRTH